MAPLMDVSVLCGLLCPSMHWSLPCAFDGDVQWLNPSKFCDVPQRSTEANVVTPVLERVISNLAGNIGLIYRDPASQRAVIASHLDLSYFRFWPGLWGI